LEEHTNTLRHLGLHSDHLSCWHWLLLLGHILHEGERKNFFNRVVVCEEHDPAILLVASTWGRILVIVQSVNAHTPTTGRWQPVLQRLAEGLVDQLCLRRVSHSETVVVEASLTSSSPCAFWFACSSNRIRWSNGSFNSVYALQISFLQTKASKRSHRPGCVELAAYQRRSEKISIRYLCGTWPEGS
jgi:hypothetical protein